MPAQLHAGYSVRTRQQERAVPAGLVLADDIGDHAEEKAMCLRHRIEQRGGDAFRRAKHQCIQVRSFAFGLDERRQGVLEPGDRRDPGIVFWPPVRRRGSAPPLRGWAVSGTAVTRQRCPSPWVTCFRPCGRDSMADVVCRSVWS